MKFDRERMSQLAPGIYDDGQGGLHLDVDELLTANGYDPTPENVARLEQEIRAIASAYGIAYDPAEQ
jgi:hypothetical protein